jgi:positive regulator of sigma E activity
MRYALAYLTIGALAYQISTLNHWAAAPTAVLFATLATIGVTNYGRHHKRQTQAQHRG